MRYVILVIASLLSSLSFASDNYVYAGQYLIITAVKPAVLITEPTDSDLKNSLERMVEQGVPMSARAAVLEKVSRPVIVATCKRVVVKPAVVKAVTKVAVVPVTKPVAAKLKARKQVVVSEADDNTFENIKGFIIHIITE